MQNLFRMQFDNAHHIHSPRCTSTLSSHLVDHTVWNKCHIHIKQLLFCITETHIHMHMHWMKNTPFHRKYFKFGESVFELQCTLNMYTVQHSHWRKLCKRTSRHIRTETKKNYNEKRTNNSLCVPTLNVQICFAKRAMCAHKIHSANGKICKSHTRSVDN